MISFIFVGVNIRGLTRTKIFVDMTEMLLKVVLNTITYNPQAFMQLDLITVLVVVQSNL